MFYILVACVLSVSAGANSCCFLSPFCLFLCSWGDFGTVGFFSGCREETETLCCCCWVLQRAICHCQLVLQSCRQKNSTTLTTHTHTQTRLCAVWYFVADILSTSESVRRQRNKSDSSFSFVFHFLFSFIFFPLPPDCSIGQCVCAGHCVTKSNCVVSFTFFVFLSSAL